MPNPSNSLVNIADGGKTDKSLYPLHLHLSFVGNDISTILFSSSEDLVCIFADKQSSPFPNSTVYHHTLLLFLTLYICSLILFLPIY